MHKSWKRISIILAAVLLISSTIATIKPLRFWAWAGDLEVVAEIAYGTAIKWEQSTLRGIQLAVDICVANQECPSATLLRLRQQEQDSIDRIHKLKSLQKEMAGGS